MRRAAEQLSHACAEPAAHMSGDEIAVREIKELAGAIKELSALNASLKSAAPPADSAVQVAFDPSGDTWRQSEQQGRRMSSLFLAC